MAFFLQTSPESAMKRLLAAGSGPIYQMTKAFRDGESGRKHNPEFTMLEWYRPGFDHHALMVEIDELLAALLDTSPGERLTYREAFLRHAGLDPFQATPAELRRCALDHGCGDVPGMGDDRDGWLSLLVGTVVEPCLGHGRPSYVLDYPASQASLARIRQGSPPVAERFELYVGGVELANGYHELTDAAEQRRRYRVDIELRSSMGRAAVPPDEHLLAALEDGLPACAGVALGVDRLVMVAAGATAIDEVLAFPVERA